MLPCMIVWRERSIPMVTAVRLGEPWLSFGFGVGAGPDLRISTLGGVLSRNDVNKPYDKFSKITNGAR